MNSTTFVKYECKIYRKQQNCLKMFKNKKPNKGLKISPPSGILTAQKLMFLGFFLRVLVAIWNGFFGPSFGAEADASTFHRTAAEFSHNLVLDEFKIGHVYSFILGITYYLTIDSLFLGSLLSCLAWLQSAVLIMKIMQLMSFNTLHRYRAMLVYALLPSSILFTSVTLREPYQLMFVNLAIYSALKILLHKSSKHWLLLLCGVVGAGLLHGTLFVFGLFILIITWFFLVYREGKKFSLGRLIIILPLVALTLSYGFSVFTTYTNYKVEEGLGTAIQLYQEGGLGYLGDARAFYKTSVEINGNFGLISFIPVSLFQYLFEPMPWRISAFLDIGLFLENILRGLLIYKSWVGLQNIHTQGRRPLLFVFLSYLMIETIWSIGTINWGTAIRHHIPGMGLLIIAGFAFMGSRKVRVAQPRFSWIKNR